MRIGVDIGGTFTDFVRYHDGQFSIHKRLSTPDDPARAMLDGLAEMTPGGIDALTHVVHGSTVATNAILERKGARAALITTQGFRDVLFIGRQNRPDLYALHPTVPPPLIPRERCHDIPERLAHTGEVLVPLAIDVLDAVLDAIILQDVDVLAVCCLYSFVNPQHEHAIRDRIRERDLWEDWQVVLSCDVLPEFREYERASTTALEAYVRPIMTQYIDNLTRQLPSSLPLSMMRSDGGVMRAASVRHQAIHTALSGPAAGVIGAHYVAQQAGFDDIITLDMGGTSTDVALCPGAPQQAPNADIDGLPLGVRRLDIETIGAGGGSIARVDAGGALRVGPHSAGATPGPVIYGRGGQHITVSDANAVLGRLDAEHALGGHLALHLGAAQQAMDDLARQTGLTRLQTARGVLDVANATIDRALRRVSVARGHDPRDFTLVAFGGAGPLHACDVADQLEIGRILIPRYPGVLCALGLLVADVVVEHSRTILADITPDLIDALIDYGHDLWAQVRADLYAEGVQAANMRFLTLADLRYRGQAHELTLAYTQGDLVAAFHAAHEQAYGHAMPHRAVEIVTLRSQGMGLMPRPHAAAFAHTDDYTPDPIATQTTEAGATLPLYQREALHPGALLRGEALILQTDATIYITPGWTGWVDPHHNIVLSREPSSQR